MSRRFRMENQRLVQTKDDDKEEKDKLKLMKERMYAPVEWKVFPNDIKIMDLKEEYFPQVLDMIKSYFISEDVLTRNTDMEEDEVSTRSFLDQCMFQMKDTTSLVAVNFRYEPYELVGCCLIRVIHKEDFGRVFSGTIMKDGEAQEKCMNIRQALQRKVDVFAEFNCTVFLRIYTVCIKPAYRKQGYGLEMMKCAFNSARSLHIPVVMGIFSTNTMQKCGKRLGMRVLYEISYVQWRSKDTKNLIFDDPGPGNYTIALMAGEVPAEPFVDAPVVVPKKLTDEEEKKPTLTRKERRELAAKKKKAQAKHEKLPST